MLRRRLFAYTVMMTAGITSGYFVMEKIRPVSGLMLMLCLAVCICRAELDSRNDRVERKVLLCLMMTGFILFTAMYICYESPVITDGGERILPGDEQQLSNIASVTGRITGITETDDGYRIIIIADNIKHAGKIQADCSDLCGDSRMEIVEKLIGRRAEINGEIHPISKPDNPGCFDYRLYMRSKGIRFTFDAYSVSICPEGNPVNNGISAGAKGVVTEAYWRYRRYLIIKREEFLDRFNDDEMSSFVRGMVFGDKSGIDDEILNEFNNNSTGHLLAVSGMHIGFLYAMLRFLSGRRHTAAISVLTIIILVMYGEMTMWSASTVRAVMVMSFSLISVHLRRHADLLTSVSAAAMTILLSQPYQLFNTGFQMTFIALCGIAFLTGPLSHFVGDTFALMLAVQITITPLAAWTFNRFNPLALLINIPVVLIASVLIPYCILLMYISMVAGSVPGALLRVASLFTDVLIRVNRLLGLDGIFTFDSSGAVPVPGVWTDQIRDLIPQTGSGIITGAGAAILACFYILIFILSSEWMRIRLLRVEKKKIAYALMLLMLPVMFFATGSYNRFADDEIVFVSVGQGDCTHIRSGSHDVLIDGGGSAFYNVGQKILMPYLLKNGADDIDLACVTHLHTDHYLGISQLAEVYPVRGAGIPSEYRESIKRSDGLIDDPGGLMSRNLIYIESGERINISRDVYIEPIWPAGSARRSLAIDDPNEKNTVYMIHYGGVKIMVTGDLMEADELSMVDHYRGTDTLKCDILKVAHHGSKSSSSEAFLDAAAPSVAVIQVGRNNLYGHPHQQTMDRLEARGIRVYRTDINGAVGIDIRRNRFISEAVNP